MLASQTALQQLEEITGKFLAARDALEMQKLHAEQQQAEAEHTQQKFARELSDRDSKLVALEQRLAASQQETASLQQLLDRNGDEQRRLQLELHESRSSLQRLEGLNLELMAERDRLQVIYAPTYTVV